MTAPRRTHAPRRLAVGVIALAALSGCGDDGGSDDDTTTTSDDTTSTITTMQPQPTGDIGNETVPDTATDGTSSTVAGAVPGQDVEGLDPPDDAPGGPGAGG